MLKNVEQFKNTIVRVKSTGPTYIRDEHDNVRDSLDNINVILLGYSLRQSVLNAVNPKHTASHPYEVQAWVEINGTTRFMKANVIDFVPVCPECNSDCWDNGECKNGCVKEVISC